MEDSCCYASSEVRIANKKSEGPHVSTAQLTGEVYLTTFREVAHSAPFKGGFKVASVKASFPRHVGSSDWEGYGCVLRWEKLRKDSDYEFHKLGLKVMAMPVK